MCQYIPFPHHPANKICLFCGSRDFLRFLYSRCHPKQVFADSVTLLSCSAATLEPLLPCLQRFSWRFSSFSLFHWCLCCLTNVYAFSSVSIRPHSLLPYCSVHHLCSLTAWGRGSPYFQGFNWHLLVWENSAGFMNEAPFCPSPSDPPRLPMCRSLPTKLTPGKSNKKREKLKTCRNLLTGIHCTPHSGLVKSELLTWNAINKFSKELKASIFSWKCLHVLPDTSEEE